MAALRLFSLPVPSKARLQRGSLPVALLLISLACGFRSQAQARPAASGPGSFVAVGAEFTGFRNQYGERYLGGETVYADVQPHWRYGFEAEARRLRINSNEGVRMADYLVGVRVQIRPGKIAPYTKLLVGAGHLTFPFNYGSGTFFMYAPGAGVEYKIGDRLILRPVDFEYQHWENFPFGQLRPFGVSAGLSFRVNGITRAPKHAWYSRWH